MITQTLSGLVSRTMQTLKVDSKEALATSNHKKLNVLGPKFNCSSCRGYISKCLPCIEY